MRLNHLALAVRDQDRSLEFYATYFGFDPSTARIRTASSSSAVPMGSGWRSGSRTGPSMLEAFHTSFDPRQNSSSPCRLRKD